jgi:uncharacterized protein (TIGR02466 family)
MQTNHLNLFPTPIAYTQGFLNEEEAKNLLNYCLSIKSKEHSAVTGNGVSTHHVSTHHYSRLFEDAMKAGVLSKAIYERLGKAILDYATVSGYKYSRITNSWCNVQNNGSGLAKHTHPKSVISGAFYLNVDKDSSPIYFHNPNTFISYFNVSNEVPHGFEWYRFYPEIGDLILFPSWLPHSSGGHKNKTNNRVAVSFNVE